MKNFIYFLLVVMATVARGHGGDAGGDPPHRPWVPPGWCESGSKKKIRGKSSGKQLDKALEKNKNRPLPIYFDHSTGTYSPIGDFAHQFTQLLGRLTDKYTAYYYPSWDEVPMNHKPPIIREIQRYFDMRSIERQFGRAYLDTLYKTLLGREYRLRKNRFVQKEFAERGGYEHPHEIRNYPPEGLTPAEWNKYVDYITNPATMTRSARNKLNREHMEYPTTQGPRSLASLREQTRGPDGRPIDLVDEFGMTHKWSDGRYVNETAAQRHASMERMREEQLTSQSSVDDTGILKSVLGERSGHSRGVGRKNKTLDRFAASSSSSQAPPPPPPDEPTIPRSQYVADLSAFGGYLHELRDFLQSQGIQAPNFASHLTPFVQPPQDNQNEHLGDDDNEGSDS